VVDHEPRLAGRAAHVFRLRAHVDRRRIRLRPPRRPLLGAGLGGAAARRRAFGFWLLAFGVGLGVFGFLGRLVLLGLLRLLGLRSLLSLRRSLLARCLGGRRLRLTPRLADVKGTASRRPSAGPDGLPLTRRAPPSTRQLDQSERDRFERIRTWPNRYAL